MSRFLAFSGIAEVPDDFDVDVLEEIHSIFCKDLTSDCMMEMLASTGVDTIEKATDWLRL